MISLVALKKQWLKNFESEYKFSIDKVAVTPKTISLKSRYSPTREEYIDSLRKLIATSGTGPFR